MTTVPINTTDFKVPELRRKEKDIVTDEEIVAHILKSSAKASKKRAKVSKTSAEAPEVSAGVQEVGAEPSNRSAPISSEGAVLSKQRQEIISKVQAYQASALFGEYVRKDLKISLNYDQLSKKNTGQLQAMLDRIRVSISKKSAGKFYDNMVNAGLVGVESAVSPFFDIEGLSAELMGNETFLILVEQYKCESELPNIPLPLQIMQCMVTTALVVNARNRVLKGAPQKVKDLSPPSTPLNEIVEIMEDDNVEKPLVEMKRPDNI